MPRVKHYYQINLTARECWFHDRFLLSTPLRLFLSLFLSFNCWNFQVWTVWLTAFRPPSSMPGRDWDPVAITCQAEDEAWLGTAICLILSSSEGQWSYKGHYCHSWRFTEDSNKHKCRPVILREITGSSDKATFIQRFLEPSSWMFKHLSSGRLYSLHRLWKRHWFQSQEWQPLSWLQLFLTVVSALRELTSATVTPDTMQQTLEASTWATSSSDDLT